MYDYDLSAAIIGGELYAKTKNSVHGWVLLADRQPSMRVELTGNACDALAGHVIRFYHPTRRSDFSKRITTLNGMVADRQIGVVSSMEQKGDVFSMEWYSQSGRIIANLQDFVVEIDPSEPAESCVQFGDHLQEPEYDCGDDDPFGLFGDYLKTDDPSYDEFVKEMDKFENIVDGNDQGIRIGSLFDEYGWSSPDGLTEDDAQELMMRVLATLARFNVAFHMCPKCTWKHAYQLIYDKLADEEFHPGMKGSGWVSHYSAEELCQPCIEEFEKEWDQTDIV